MTPILFTDGCNWVTDKLPPFPFQARIILFVCNKLTSITFKKSFSYAQLPMRMQLLLNCFVLDLQRLEDNVKQTSCTENKSLFV